MIRDEPRPFRGLFRAMLYAAQHVRQVCHTMNLKEVSRTLFSQYRLLFWKCFSVRRNNRQNFYNPFYFAFCIICNILLHNQNHTIFATLRIHLRKLNIFDFRYLFRFQTFPCSRYENTRFYRVLIAREVRKKQIFAYGCV